MKTILCYGSLKSGFHNNYRLGEKAVFLGFRTVLGVMYLHHNYPKLYKPTDKPLNNGLQKYHNCEIWQINDDTYNDIKKMELYEGYEEETIETRWDKKTGIFWMPWKNFNDKDIPILEYNYNVLDKNTKEYLEKYANPKPFKVHP